MKDRLALFIQVGDVKVGIDSPGGIPLGGIETDGKGGAILRWGITFLLAGAIVLALFFLVWGGIQWITSGGDKTKIQDARKKMMYAIIGLIICFLAFFIVSLIGNVFGAKFF